MAAILGNGIDTLVLGAYASLKDGLFDRFEDEMANAKELQHLASYKVGDSLHALKRGGGAWKWMLLLSQFWTIRLSHRKQGDAAPQIQLQLRAPLLWQAGAERAARQALELCEKHFCSTPIHRVIVTRADVCMDWIEWEPTDEQLRSVVKRPRFASASWEPSKLARERLELAGYHAALSALKGDEEHPEAPRTPEAAAAAAAKACLAAVRACARSSASFRKANLEEDSQGHEFDWRSGKIYTGHTWGKSKGHARCNCYRKDIEIARRSFKYWLYDYWADRPGVEWQQGELAAAVRYLRTMPDGEQRPVWRLEFQLKRAFFRTIRCDTADDMFAALPAIWKYLTMSWLKLCEPREARTGNDVRRTRLKLHPEWAQLAAGWRAERECPILRKRIRELSYERTRAIITLGSMRLVAHARELLGERFPDDALHDPSAATELLLDAVLEDLEEREEGWEQGIERYLERLARPQTADAFSPGEGRWVPSPA